jgi:hypothetical protein
MGTLKPAAATEPVAELQKETIMSFITVEHTAVTWIEKELTSALKFALKAATVAYAGLNYGSTLIEVVIGQVAGTAAETEATTVLTEALSLLAAAKAALYDTQDVSSVGALLDKVIANLNTILTDAHITNTNSVALITKVLKALDAIVKAIESDAGVTTSTTTSTATATA